MMGFVYKDFLVLRKIVGTLAVMVGVYVVLMYTGVLDYTILPAVVVMLSTVFPVNAFSYDHQSRWDQYAAVTPAGRKGIVGGRYLFTALLLLGMAAAAYAVTLVVELVQRGQGSPLELLGIVVTCIAIALLLDAVLLPLLFKFGAEKARVIMLLVFAVLAAVGVVFSRLTSRGLVELPDQMAAAAIAAVTALSAAIFGVSYLISLRIMERKEL